MSTEPFSNLKDPHGMILDELTLLMERKRVRANLPEMRRCARRILVRLNENLLTADQAARYLGVCKPTLNRWIREKGLITVELNPGARRIHRRFPHGDLIRFKCRLKSGIGPGLTSSQGNGHRDDPKDRFGGQPEL